MAFATFSVLIRIGMTCIYSGGKLICYTLCHSSYREQFITVNIGLNMA